MPYGENQILERLGKMDEFFYVIFPVYYHRCLFKNFFYKIRFSFLCTPIDIVLFFFILKVMKGDCKLGIPSVASTAFGVKFVYPLLRMQVRMANFWSCVSSDVMNISHLWQVCTGRKTADRKVLASLAFQK